MVAQDTTVCIWDGTSHEELHCLERHASAVHALAFSPDGATLASGGWDKALVLWDTASGEIQRELTLPAAIAGVAYIDSARILAATGKAMLQVDANSGDILASMGGGDRQGEITALALTPSGSRLVTGSRDTTLGLWDIDAAGQPPLQGASSAPIHSDVVTAVAAGPDGRTVASSSWDKSVLLWRLGEPEAPAISLDCAHDSGVTALAFSSGAGEHLVTGSDDRSLKVWAVSSDGAQAPQDVTATLLPESLLPDDLLGVTSLACLPDPDADLAFVSGGKDMRVRLWRLRASPDAPPSSVSTLAEHSRLVASVAASADGRWVASGSKDGTVSVCEIIGRGDGAQPTPTRFELSSAVMGVAFSADAALLAAACEDGTVALCEVSSGAVQRRLGGHHKGSVNAVAFSPVGDVIATGGRDMTVALWDAASGERLEACIGHRRAVTSVAFTTDGTQVVSGSEDRDVRLWSVSKQ